MRRDGNGLWTFGPEGGNRGTGCARARVLGEDEGDRLLAAHRAAMPDFKCALPERSPPSCGRPTQRRSRVTEHACRTSRSCSRRANAPCSSPVPQDRIQALKQKFSDRPASISYALSDGVDVRVRVDDTVIETQLGAWMQALGALPADDAAAGRSRRGAGLARKTRRARRAPSERRSRTAGNHHRPPLTAVTRRPSRRRLEDRLRRLRDGDDGVLSRVVDFSHRTTRTARPSSRDTSTR